MRDRQSSATTASRRPPFAIVWRIGVSIAVGLLAGAFPRSAAAHAPGPTGTISCSVVATANPTRERGFHFRPFVGSVPTPVVRVRATNTDSACDASGVTGGKAPIIGVALTFSGKLSNETCAVLTSSPQFENGRVKLKWQSLTPAGHRKTVAVSNADLATASFDVGSSALVLTTQPIAGGAFVGATATLHLGFDMDAATFNSQCAGGASFVSMPFGQFNPSTVDVQ